MSFQTFKISITYHANVHHEYIKESVMESHLSSITKKLFEKEHYIYIFLNLY